MHLAMRPTPCTTGQVHLLVIYNCFSLTRLQSQNSNHTNSYVASYSVLEIMEGGSTVPLYSV